MRRSMRSLLPAVLAVLVLAAGSGCSSLRSLFSDPGAEKRRAGTRRSRQRGDDDDDLKSRRYQRDPLDALIFNDRSKPPSWTAESELSDSERAALRNDLDPDDRSSKKAIDQIYLRNERSRKKRADWVFGPNPFRE